MQINKIDNTNFQGRFYNNEQIRRLNSYALHHELAPKLDKVLSEIDKKTSKIERFRLKDSSIEYQPVNYKTFKPFTDPKAANPIEKKGVEYLINEISKVLGNDVNLKPEIIDNDKAFRHVQSMLDNSEIIA